VIVYTSCRGLRVFIGHSVCKCYRRAVKQAMTDETHDLDGEISELYLRKDINRFWQKLNSKFSKKNLIPSMVNGGTGDNQI